MKYASEKERLHGGYRSNKRKKAESKWNRVAARLIAEHRRFNAYTVTVEVGRVCASVAHCSKSDQR